MPQDHNLTSPFYPPPSCCLDLNESEYRDSSKHMYRQNSLYRPVFPPTFPRIFTPRCVSSNKAYDPTRGGLETFVVQPQVAQSAELPLVKPETD